MTERTKSKDDIYTKYFNGEISNKRIYVKYFHDAIKKQRNLEPVDDMQPVFKMQVKDMEEFWNLFKNNKSYKYRKTRFKIGEEVFNLGIIFFMNPRSLVSTELIFQQFCTLRYEYNKNTNCYDVLLTPTIIPCNFSSVGEFRKFFYLFFNTEIDIFDFNKHKPFNMIIFLMNYFAMMKFGTVILPELEEEYNKKIILNFNYIDRLKTQFNFDEDRQLIRKVMENYPTCEKLSDFLNSCIYQAATNGLDFYHDNNFKEIINDKFPKIYEHGYTPTDTHNHEENKFNIYCCTYSELMALYLNSGSRENVLPHRLGKQLNATLTWDELTVINSLYDGIVQNRFYLPKYAQEYDLNNLLYFIFNDYKNSEYFMRFITALVILIQSFILEPLIFNITSSHNITCKPTSLAFILYDPLEINGFLIPNKYYMYWGTILLYEKVNHSADLFLDNYALFMDKFDNMIRIYELFTHGYYNIKFDFIKQSKESGYEKILEEKILSKYYYIEFFDNISRGRNSLSFSKSLMDSFLDSMDFTFHPMHKYYKI